MAAGVYNIVADAGADYPLTVIYQDDMGDPIDLTGYTAAAGFGPQPGSSKSLLVLTTPTYVETLTGVTGISTAITLTFSGADVIPVDSEIVVSGITGFAENPNGTFTVTASSPGSVSYVALALGSGSWGSDGTVTSEPQGLTIATPANGEIVLALTNEQTAALPPGGFWELNIELGGFITRLLDGAFTMNPGVPT